MCSPDTVVPCSRSEKEKQSSNAIFREKRTAEIQFCLGISFIFHSLDALAYVLAPFLNVAVCSDSQSQSNGQQEKLLPIT